MRNGSKINSVSKSKEILKIYSSQRPTLQMSHITFRTLMFIDKFGFPKIKPFPRFPRNHMWFNWKSFVQLIGWNLCFIQIIKMYLVWSLQNLIWRIYISHINCIIENPGQLPLILVRDSVFIICLVHRT